MMGFHVLRPPIALRSSLLSLLSKSHNPLLPGRWVKASECSTMRCFASATRGKNKKQRLDEACVERFNEYSRTLIQSWIIQGKVLVDGRRVNKAGMPVSNTAAIKITAEIPKFVCRGGLKLEAALEKLDVDVISSSQKPVVSQNYLSDFTSIHAKFLGPLPSNVDDFISSLSSAFPNVVDLSQFMKEISPLSNISNLPAAMSSLNRFFAPVDVEVANQGCPVKLDEGNPSHGQNAVMISQLFAKLCTIQKSDRSTLQSNEDFQALASDEHANSGTSCSKNAGDENVKVWSKNTRRVSSENLVFIWGLVKKMTAAKLKNVLQNSHPVFAREFDVKYLDRSCAIVVFWESGPSETFVSAVNNEEQLDGSLREMVAEGLRVAGYETYKRACRLGFWEADLADSLDKALESEDIDADSDTKPSEIDWSNELAINFDEL